MIATAIVFSGLLAANSASPRPPFEPEIDAAIADAVGVYPVPKALVLAVISVESAFDPHAVSLAGAVGLMQLMPATARRVGLAGDELTNPRRNILGGVRLLAVLLRHYEGDVVSSLVAYNARPRRLFARLPQNGETPEYVRRVLSRTRWYRRLLNDRVRSPLYSAGLSFDSYRQQRSMQASLAERNQVRSAWGKSGPRGKTPGSQGLTAHPPIVSEV